MRPLKRVVMVCLLGFFVLPISTSQTHAKNSEIAEPEENLETSDAVQQRLDPTIDYKKALELNPLSPAAKRLLENAIIDRQIYEERIRDNARVSDTGVTIRQGRILPRE